MAAPRRCNHVVLQQNLSALHYGLMLATGLLAGLCGPLLYLADGLQPPRVLPLN